MIVPVRSARGTAVPLCKEAQVYHLLIRFACHAQISNRREFLRGFTPACAPLWTLGHSLTLRSQRVTEGFAVLQAKFIRP
jgi:hypothetical protein